MYEKLESCPSCGHTHFNNYIICTDHAFSKESFALVKCSKCELVFTNPRPDKEKIKEYYKSDTYISHTNAANNIINFLYKIVRSFTLRSKYRLISKYKAKKRILDFGCGTGHFVNYMDNKGWDASGYEPYIEPTNLNANIKIYKSTNEIKDAEKFDVITAWHVLEHVHDLKETLKLLRKRLKKGGVLFIALPNLNSYDANIYKDFWAAYDVPRHLYHFSRKSFKRLVEHVKLNLVKTDPMKFDAYYVALLSEKYKGTNNPYKALINGFKSNRRATKTREYSSLIYVLKA